MSINKRNGKYQVRVTYKDKEGNRRSKNKGGIKTLREAKIIEADLKLQAENGFEDLAEDIIFADYFEEWTKTYKLGLYGAVTEGKYLREVRYVRKFFKHTKLVNVTRKQYQEYINMRGQGNGKDTVVKAHGKLKSCLKLALADGLIRIDPTYNAVLRYDNKPQTKAKAYSYHQAQGLAEYFKEDLSLNNMMLYIALTTGLRIGEVYGLSYEDFKADKLSVKRGYDYNVNKDFTDGKNYSSIRTIVITKDLYTKVLAYKLANQKHNSKYMFLDGFNKSRISHTGLSKHLKRACQELGLPYLKIHALRHTHCSTLIFQGVSIYYISKRLGHSNVTETLKTYAHMIDEYEQQQEEKIVDVLEKFSN